jgi:ATP-binding cassette subfamily A (ABC1) protein 3
MYNIAFSIIPAILVSFIVLEKEGNLKHQQMISGMSLASYWLSNFLYDIIFNLILASIGIGLLYAFDVDITYSYATILMYEVSIISFSYASSFIFKSESIAMNVTLGVHMFCGILLGPVFMILRQFEDTQLAADVLVWPLRLIPSFAFADALLSITNVNLFALAYNMTTVPSNLSFHIGGGGSWLFFGIDFVLSWIILILVESRVFIKKPRINEYVDY